jgi:hypothetical protein
VAHDIGNKQQFHITTLVWWQCPASSFGSMRHFRVDMLDT